jgi:hypothetical protein
MKQPAFATLEEAFRHCRDIDASLNERLEAFSEATRYLIPGYQEAVDRMVGRFKSHDAGQSAPRPGEMMPAFAMPDEEGRLVTLDGLLDDGPQRAPRRARHSARPAPPSCSCSGSAPAPAACSSFFV